MKILLVNLPVHIPTVMPYSLAMMKAVLVSSLDEEIFAIDLNSIYHFNEFHDFYKRKEEENYFSLLDEFVNETRHVYGKISKSVVLGKIPEGHDFLLKKIIDNNPDIVAFSITYNSQVFFAKAIIKELLKKEIKVVLGGPGDYSKIKEGAVVLPDYEKLIEYCISQGAKCRKKRRVIKKTKLDFSFFDKKEYFTKDIIYPLRTAFSCPYKRCAFCTHHQNINYDSINLNFVKESIINNKMKKICFIDDDFPIIHLEKLADMLIPLKVQWWCQLRPVKELFPLLPKLKQSGLRSVAWGVESGSQRILDLIQKGTNVEDIESILKKSKELGIKNQLYIMFGFPRETESEFMKTIEFLKKNKKSIDLVSPSTFGLQKGSKIFNEPGKYGIKDIKFIERTMLSDKIEYIPENGLTQIQAENLKKRFLGELNKINKIPRAINSCKEQVLNLDQ